MQEGVIQAAWASRAIAHIERLIKDANSKNYDPYHHIRVVWGYANEEEAAAYQSRNEERQFGLLNCYSNDFEIDLSRTDRDQWNEFEYGIHAFFPGKMLLPQKRPLNLQDLYSLLEVCDSEECTMLPLIHSDDEADMSNCNRYCGGIFIKFTSDITNGLQLLDMLLSMTVCRRSILEYFQEQELKEK